MNLANLDHPIHVVKVVVGAVVDIVVDIANLGHSNFVVIVDIAVVEDVDIVDDVVGG